jgi:hypothetical protein
MLLCLQDWGRYGDILLQMATIRTATDVGQVIAIAKRARCAGFSFCLCRCVANQRKGCCGSQWTASPYRFQLTEEEIWKQRVFATEYTSEALSTWRGLGVVGCDSVLCFCVNGSPSELLTLSEAASMRTSVPDVLRMPTARVEAQLDYMTQAVDNFSF